jgi:hypothetical protein
VGIVLLARSIKSIEDGEKRSIGNETDNGEMEVMEVPDPEDLPPEVTATATRTTTAASATPTPTPGNTMAAIVSQLMYQIFCGVHQVIFVEGSCVARSASEGTREGAGTQEIRA